MSPTKKPSGLPTEPPTLKPTVHGLLSDCIESDVNNTSPTLKSITTSSAVDDATVECMVRNCQIIYAKPSYK